VSAEPLDSLTAREMLRVLDEELAALPERYRAPLVLCYLQERTQDEAARELGWSKATLRRRLDRGRTLLRARLTGRGVLAPSAGIAAALAAADLRAAVPPALVGAAVRAARWFATGEGIPVTVGAAILAEHGLRLLAAPKLKAPLTLAAAACLLCLVTGMTLQQARAPEAAGGAAVSAPADKARQGLDAGGDPLPSGAMARLGTLRFRHGMEGGYLAYSPDGKIIAQASPSGILLWDAATGKLQRRLKEGAEKIAFSPDGRSLVQATTRSDYGDGRGVVSGVVVRDLATGAERYRFPNSVGFALSPDGKLLAHSAGDWVVLLCDFASGRELRRLDGSDGHGGCTSAPLAFSPDGKTLAAESLMNEYILWDVASGKRKCTVASQSWFVAFSPDGKSLLLEAGAFDTTTGKPRPDFGDAHQFLRLLTTDGRLVYSYNRDLCERRWDTECRRQLPDLEGWFPLPTGALSPDSRTLAVALGGSLRFWDLDTRKETVFGPGHQGPVGLVRFSPDGRKLTSRDGGNALCEWDLGTAAPIRRTAANTDAPRSQLGSAALSPDGRELATATTPGPVHLWDAHTGDFRRSGPEKWKTPGGPVAAFPAPAVAYSPDGTLLAGSINDATIQLWETATGREIRTLKGHTDHVTCLAFTPDGKALASGSQDHSLCLWDVATGRELRLIGWQPASPQLVAFAPDGKTVAVAHGPPSAGREGCAVHLYDVATGGERGRLIGHDKPVAALAFRPDGKRLASGGEDGVVRLWDLERATEVGRLTGHRGAVRSLDFSPDGKRIASGGDDTTVLVWDPESVAGR
jgi:WD40 repeat protein